MVAITGKIVEEDTLLHVCIGSEVQRVVRGEGGGIVRVGHHTHLKSEHSVRGGGLLRGEFQLQVLDGIQGGVDGRHNSVLRSIGSCRAREELQAYRAAVGIGRAAVHRRTTCIGGHAARVDVSPARGQIIGSGGSRRIRVGVEILRIRNAHRETVGDDRYGVGRFGNASRTAVSHHTEHVCRVGGQARDSGGDGRGVMRHPYRIALFPVLHDPGTFRASGGPTQGDGIGRDIGSRQVVLDTEAG